MLVLSRVHNIYYELLVLFSHHSYWFIEWSSYGAYISALHHTAIAITLTALYWQSQVQYNSRNDTCSNANIIT